MLAAYNSELIFAEARIISFDILKLLPAMTYPYEVVAVSRAGGVSAPVSVELTTQKAFSHLVVTDLKITPEHPQAGQEVHFQATLANRGDAATEEGVVTSVTFSVDGHVICWSDNSTHAVAPGKEVTLTPDNGPTGATTWTMTPDPHRMTAVADDVNRIAEADKSQHTLTIDVTHATQP